MKLRDLHSKTPIQAPNCTPPLNHSVRVVEGESIKAVPDQQNPGTELIGCTDTKPNGAEGQDRASKTSVAPLQTETEPDEVSLILQVWEGLGLHLDRNAVSTHLSALRQWESQWGTANDQGQTKTRAEPGPNPSPRKGE